MAQAPEVLFLCVGTPQDETGQADLGQVPCAGNEVTSSTFTKLMGTPTVIDGRRQLEAARLAEAGVTYRAVGRGDLRVGDQAAYDRS